MPKSARTSRSRRSSQHILNFSSDLEQNTRRDSKWWRNLSDRSVRRSLIRNGSLRENENATLSDGSYPCEAVNSQWWKELNEDESTILQRNAFKNRNRSNSVVEEDDKTQHESHTEDNDENVARKTIFTGRERRPENHRFSKAFHLEQSKINEPQAQEKTDTHDNVEKSKRAETDIPTRESSKRKLKRKTVQLFSRKPYSQRFSEAFHSVEEEKIESAQQDKSNFESQPDNEEQHSEIIVPATQESQETRRKSQVGVAQDTLSNIEENIEVNETFAKNKTNLDTTAQKENLFSNIPKVKRTFSEAFIKTTVDETCVGANKEPETTEKVTKNDDTIGMELNQSVEIRKGLFEQKQTQSRKFSEAFSKTKHTDDPVDKSNQEITERISKSHITESEQSKNVDVLSNEQTENIGTVRKSTRISKNNDTNQMEVNENIQIKQNLFQANIRETRKFSEAFSDTKNLELSSVELSNLQAENNVVDENSKITRKSTRISKQINETNQMEMSENVQPKNLFHTVDKKENRKFSNAFAKSKITEHEIERDDNLSKNETREIESARRSIKSTKQKPELLSVPNESDTNDENTPARKSLRLSKINETKQMEISENVQSKQDLFKAKVKETRKFSEAFAETKTIEKSVGEEELSDNQEDNNMLRVNSKMSERKSTRKSENNTINQTDINEVLQAKKELFKNKIKESRKFSEAFAKSTFEEQLDNKTTENQGMQRNKSTGENKTDQLNESSHLSTLPSINDTVGDDKKILFKPKARKSLFSQRNTPSRMKKIDENAVVESDPNPQPSPAELSDQNVVFSDSVISKFFETSLISSTKLINNPNLTRRNSRDDSQVEENQNENKNESQNRKSHISPQGTSMQTEDIERSDQESSLKEINESEAQINKDKFQNKRSLSSKTVQQEISKHKETGEESHQKKQIDVDEEEKNKDKHQSKTRSINIVPQEILISAEQTEKPENANTECDAPAEEIVNKDVKKIPVLRTSSKKIRTSKTLQNKSELTNNESNVQSNSTLAKSNKTTTEYEDINAAENSETRIGLKNISKRATRSNEDNSQESQISHSPGKRSSKFITDDIQTYISNNTSSRVSTTAESTDKTPEEKPETRTSSHKNTSKFNLNDIEKNVTYNKSNRISVQQDTGKNTTEIQTIPRSSSLKYSTNSKEISIAELKSKGDASLKPTNVIKTQVNDKKLQMQKEMLLKAMNEINPRTSQITAKQLQSKKFMDFFSKINYKEIPKVTQNKVTKSKPKPIPSALLVNGKKYKPPKLFSGEYWCNKRFYKYLQNKLQNKYEETTIVESENLMKFIANSTKIILKSKQYAAGEIKRLKKELARHNVISTTFDFYELVENYMPYDIRDKIVPCTRAHYVTPTVPYDHEGLYKKIKF